jgi:hypothetical protein
LPADPHQEYRELCALSTTGELTAEEWNQLTEHLAGCNACRRVKEQYERVAGLMIPALAAEAHNDSMEDSAEVMASSAWSIDEAEARLMESLRDEPAPLGIHLTVGPKVSQWQQVRRYAIAALVLLACSVSGYQFGVLRGHRPVAEKAATNPSLPRVAADPGQLTATPVPSHSRKADSQEDQNAKLRAELRQSQMETARGKDEIRQIEDELAQRNADLDRSLKDRADLNRQLAQVQASAQALETRLAAMSNRPSQDAAQSLAFKAQIEDLNAAIATKDGEIARQQELLQRDHDIRNLIGARNLYIAEIYDVGKNGATQKPFGRVFYTKDKSLIFYGYDLDQQKGVRKDASFQAWGRRGPDGKHDVSLGLLYQDDSNQKRWVLKFNDATTISELDAVFITVEPEGGSTKPSSKPLLFTYLHLDPNHP